MGEDRLGAQMRDPIAECSADLSQSLAWAERAFGSAGPFDEAKYAGFIGETPTPFSFVYGSEPTSEFIANWQRKSQKSELKDRVSYTVSWTDPETGLVVTAEATAFKEFPAVEWLLHFENTGKADTPILADVQAADVSLATTNPKATAVIHRLMGDDCSERSFTPFESALPSGANIDMAAVNGRPSQGTGFPFWNLQYGDRGVITAIGWSGQWAAHLARAQDGVTRFTAGMERIHTVLHPGEKIRTPRVLMMPYSGDRVNAQNRYRRLMLAKYVPQENGKPKRLPVFLQCFDRYVRAVPEWSTEAGQLKGIRTAKELGFDGFWFDAAWFPGGFPSGVGNWFADPQKFPNGLKPLGDLCKEFGLQFVLWFEPCRVGDNSEISHEHAEWVYGGAKGGLFNLGNPEARRWMTDRLSKLISEWGITCYREDYNIDPLGYWRADEPEDRQGMNEIRFVEGHYAMWDELRAKHPGLWIDNCASGGRRIDLETVMRAVPLWRSDIGCWATEPAWHQMEVMALSQYVPISSCAAWEPVPYQTRSTAAAGLQLTLGYLDENFDAAAAKRVVAEAQENRKYWYGDLYNLTPVNSRLDNFAAYQLHLADSNEGVVMAFRRAESACVGIIPALRGLDPNSTYQLEFVDEAFKKTTAKATGKELMEQGLTLRIPTKAASLMVRYKPAAK